MRRVLLALSLLTCASPIAAQQATNLLRWEELGPAPIIGSSAYTGRVSAVVCSPTDPGRYFISGADGGVWRTTDGGASWTPLTDFMATTSIGALALDPTDEDVIYAGTGEGNYANHSRYGLGILKSTDGGDSWEHLAESVFAGRSFSAIVVSPSNPQRVFASITRAGGFPELAAAKGHPGATGDIGVFRSEDGGATWTHLAGGLPNVSATSLALDPTDADTLYAGIGRIFGSPQNGVYKTSDGGASWVKLGGGLPTSAIGRVSVAVAPSQASRLYTLITNPADSVGGSAFTLGAWRSTDGGVSWTSLPIGSLQASYGWYLSVVTVDPSDHTTVLMGGLNLGLSTNSGNSWSTVTPPHVDLHAAAWDAAGRLIVGDDGGVHRTSTLGGSWGTLNDGLGLVQFYAGFSTSPTDDEWILAGAQDNGTNRRNSPTTTWTQVFGGDGGWTQADQTSPDRLFCEFQGTGNLYRSLDGGSGWGFTGNGIDGSDRNCFLPPFLIDPTDSTRMLYATHRVYRSADAGSSWTPISSDLTNGTGAIRSLAIAPSNPDYVYAATNDGNVLVSSNGGATFLVVRTNHPGWPRVTRELFVHPTVETTVWLAVAAFGTDQILRSHDAGQTWVAVDQGLPDIPVNTVSVIPGAPARIFAGTDAGLYVSMNGGQTYGRYGTGLPHAPVIDLKLDAERQRILVATQGRGVWRARLIAPISAN